MSLNYIIVAGGCFWGLEELFRKFKGVTATKVGYTGGNFKNPIYADVSRGDTGHAEAVHIEFDESLVSLKEILHYFYRIHDPTTKNQQGNDRGSQYRSALYYRDEDQKEIIQKVIQEVNQLHRFANPIVTEVEPEGDFYDAEEFHQKYLVKYPSGYTCHFERD